MSWGEAIRLTGQLTLDWSSSVSAAVLGWDYPMSHEAKVLTDLFDLTHSVNAKRRPKPYPRPWRTDEHKTFGAKTRLTREELRAILDANRN